MRKLINYKRVQPGTKEYADLQEFAESFNHYITPSATTNTLAHYRDGVLFGYSDHVFVPTVYPAFHPEFTKPSDVIQVMNDWRAHAQLAGNAGYIAVPSNNNDGKGNFPESVMQKLGLIRLNRELYWPT